MNLVPTSTTLRLAIAIAVTTVVLVGCGGGGDDGTPATPDQTIRVQAFEYDFASDVVPDISVGDTVRFIVQNTGEMDHEMQVIDPAGLQLGETGRIAPRGVVEIVVTFDEAGVHQLICDIDDHLSLGQMAIFEVTAA